MGLFVLPTSPRRPIFMFTPPGVSSLGAPPQRDPGPPFALERIPCSVALTPARFHRPGRLRSLAPAASLPGVNDPSDLSSANPKRYALGLWYPRGQGGVTAPASRQRALPFGEGSAL